MREKYSLYDYVIEKLKANEFIYKIFNYKSNEILRESGELYDTEQEARFAAIGHISDLENGEG